MIETEQVVETEQNRWWGQDRVGGGSRAVYDRCWWQGRTDVRIEQVEEAGQDRWRGQDRTGVRGRAGGQKARLVARDKTDYLLFDSVWDTHLVHWNKAGEFFQIIYKSQFASKFCTGRKSKYMYVYLTIT